MRSIILTMLAVFVASIGLMSCSDDKPEVKQDDWTTGLREEYANQSGMDGFLILGGGDGTMYIELFIFDSNGRNLLSPNVKENVRDNTFELRVGNLYYNLGDTIRVPNNKVPFSIVDKNRKEGEEENKYDHCFRIASVPRPMNSYYDPTFSYLIDMATVLNFVWTERNIEVEIRYCIKYNHNFAYDWGTTPVGEKVWLYTFGLWFNDKPTQTEFYELVVD